MCIQIFHMVNIDVPAGVGAPPLNTQLQNIEVNNFGLSITIKCILLILNVCMIKKFSSGNLR